MLLDTIGNRCRHSDRRGGGGGHHLRGGVSGGATASTDHHPTHHPRRRWGPANHHHTNKSKRHGSDRTLHPGTRVRPTPARLLPTSPPDPATPVRQVNQHLTTDSRQQTSQRTHTLRIEVGWLTLYMCTLFSFSFFNFTIFDCFLFLFPFFLRGWEGGKGKRGWGVSVRHEGWERGWGLEGRGGGGEGVVLILFCLIKFSVARRREMRCFKKSLGFSTRKYIITKW